MVDCDGFLKKKKKKKKNQICNRLWVFVVADYGCLW